MNFIKNVLTLFLAVIAGGVFAQTMENPNNIRVAAGIQDSFGPFERENFPFGIGNQDNVDEVYQISFSRYMNEFFDLGLGITAGGVDNLWDKDNNVLSSATPSRLEKGSIADFDLGVKYKFYNNLDFKENALFTYRTCGYLCF